MLILNSKLFNTNTSVLNCTDDPQHQLDHFSSSSGSTQNGDDDYDSGDSIADVSGSAGVSPLAVGPSQNQQCLSIEVDQNDIGDGISTLSQPPALAVDLDAGGMNAVNSHRSAVQSHAFGRQFSDDSALTYPSPEAAALRASAADANVEIVNARLNALQGQVLDVLTQNRQLIDIITAKTQ